MSKATISLSSMNDSDLIELRAKARRALRSPEDERYDFLGTQVLIGQINAELDRKRELKNEP
jgi:hypothetical protein